MKHWYNLSLQKDLKFLVEKGRSLGQMNREEGQYSGIQKKHTAGHCQPFNMVGNVS